LTRGSNRAHIVRATLEAIAYQTRDVVEVMMRDAHLKLDALRVDGGATSNDWLMQFQADILGVPVERPDMIETTALGAAGLAGLSAGVWKSAEDFLATRTFTTFAPRTTRESAAALTGGWRRAVRAAIGWARDRA